jgi:hypothetical protein
MAQALAQKLYFSANVYAANYQGVCLSTTRLFAMDRRSSVTLTNGRVARRYYFLLAGEEPHQRRHATVSFLRRASYVLPKRKSPIAILFSEGLPVLEHWARRNCVRTAAICSNTSPFVSKCAFEGIDGVGPRKVMPPHLQSS